MNKLKRLVLVSLLSLSVLFPARATHIVGGEIGYECLGNDLYQITLTVYRDCFYGEVFFDDTASVGFFVSYLDDAKYDLRMLATPTDTLSVSLDDPCLVVPPNVCVEVMQYVDTISLPYEPDGYTIVYQRCCRNETVVNIYNPLETGATFVTEMTGESMTQCNTSPVFVNWPPVAICVGQPLDFDHSATDVDGDSIVYSLCMPFLGGQHSSVGNPKPQPPEVPIDQEVPLISPPFSVDDFLGGVPLTIDPVTGQMFAVPNSVGQFVVGVCIQEFRNGQLLSSTKRDFQFNVSDCGEIVSSFFAPDILCDELTVDFNNNSTNANSYSWNFGVSGIDSDTSILVSPTYTFPDTGAYNISLFAIRNEACKDTFIKELVLNYSTFDVGMEWNVIGCDDSIHVEVVDMTIDSVYETASWQWTLSNDLTTTMSNDQNPIFTIVAAPNTTLHGTVASANGCVKEVDFDFPYFVVEAIPDTTIGVCRGVDVHLNPNYIDSVHYEWLPPTGLDDSTLPNPIVYDIQESVSYSVEALGWDSVCVQEFDVSILVSENTVLAQATPDTILLGETSQLFATGDVANSYYWSPESEINNVAIQNPVVSPLESTSYQVVSTNPFGCADTAMVRVVVLNPTCNLPNVFVPSGFTPNNDGNNDFFRVYGYIVESVELMVYDRWGEKVFESNSQYPGWDGRYKGKELPSDVYGYYVKVGCVNGETYEHKGNVTLLR